MSLHLPALYWLSSLGGRLDISVDSKTPATDDCLLPAITMHVGSEGVHISRPQRASSSASLPLWQIAGAKALIGVRINAVVDPRCTYRVRYAFRV